MFSQADEGYQAYKYINYKKSNELVNHNNRWHFGNCTHRYFNISQSKGQIGI
jgi:hypothetical protein